MAIQISGTTVIDNSRNVKNVVSVGETTTTIYYGDGSNLSGINASGSDFYTGISSTVQIYPESFEQQVFTFPSTSGKQYIIQSINVSNSLNSTDEVNLIASIEDTSEEKTFFSYNIPIANGGSVELLKNPIVAGPSDIIKMWVTDSNYIGVVDAAEVYMNYSEYTSTDYVRKFASDVSIATTSLTTLYTSITYPTVIESIHITNRTDNGNYPVSILVKNGTIETYLVKDLVIPRYSSVDILDRPKRIEVDGIIQVKVLDTSTIDVIISGKKIIS
jgi:hypothetical protein